MSENATPRTLAEEWISDPDARAQIQVRLRTTGHAFVADALQEGVELARHLLRALDELTAANARIAELEKIIGEHNDGCVASCRARTCGYKKADGVTLIYGQRRCPECPVDWMIEDAALAASERRCAELEKALRNIAAFSDQSANQHLAATGSYGAFDEPCSVAVARAALAAQDGGKV